MNYSISCRKLLRHFGISIITCAFGFGLVVVSIHAQSGKSTANQKEEIKNDTNKYQTTK